MENNNNIKKGSKGVKVLNSIIIVILSLVLIGSVSAFYLLDGILNDPDAPKYDASSLETQESSVIYDTDGNVIIELSREDGTRENVSYDQIPQVVVDAFLSIEDSRFYKHNGFDLPRFIKSALENVKQGNLGQGGSTLTMQMIDVSHMSKLEKAPNGFVRIARKVQEIFLSMQAESHISKQQILEKYLNLINFGGPARGIQKGAQYYFGKDVSQVTLSEAAFLAGVINAPNGFDPYYNYDAAIERRNETLDLMLYHGYITEEEHELAANTELAFQLSGPIVFETSPYLSYIDKVREEIIELTGGLDPTVVGMEIYTSMDRGAQELADQILNGEAGINYPENDELFQVGFSLMNNQNGEIIALGGGRGYDGDNRRNRAYGVVKQSGSSIKPLIDYCLTFDYLGWATDHILLDAPMKYRGTNTPFYNADGQNRGDVTYQYAVAVSLNTTAITALQELCDTIGVDKVLEHMKKLGFSAFENLTAEDFSFGYGIGGADMTTTPVEMAGAFSIFANNGNYIEPHTIRKIVFKDGKTESIEPNYESVNVISPQAAYLMSVLLEDAVSTNWQNLLQIMISPYPVYGKTGTTDWAQDGLAYGIPEVAMKDKWMVVYTSKYTAATWAGYDEPVAGKFTWFDTNKMLLNVPGQINKKLFDFIHQNNYPSAIQQPSGIVSVTHVKGAFDNGYYAVPEGTPDEMISTGLIKSEFATLNELKPDELSELKTFTAELDDATSKVNFKFTPYPEAEKLEPFDGKYHGVEGYPNFSGTKLYDPSAIFGEVVYRVEVTSNNISLGSFDYATDTASELLPIMPGQKVEVCGSYAYKNGIAASNKICTTIESKDDDERPNRPTDPTDPNEPIGPGNHTPSDTDKNDPQNNHKDAPNTEEPLDPTDE